MIREALIHLPGIGPERLKRLHACGFRTWEDVLARPEAMPVPDGVRDNMLAELRRCEQALVENDLRYLTSALDTTDQWRLLGHSFDQLSYFDIETTGLEVDAQITLIACWHRGELKRFMLDENLDAFLDLLDEVKLLVSFNGATFDVPRVLSHFHIPELPCAHIDLRWLCQHRGLTGGLKSIEPRLGIQRPPDLVGVGGAEAVWLWRLWEQMKNRQARAKLERYCCADVLALQLVTARLLEAHGHPVAAPTPAELWRALDQHLGPAAVREPLPDTPRPLILPGGRPVHAPDAPPPPPVASQSAPAPAAPPKSAFPLLANTPAAAARLLQQRLRELRKPC